MHVFSLGENEAVVIGEDIVVRVVEIRKDTVQIEIRHSHGDTWETEYEEYQLTTEPAGEGGPGW